MSFNDIFKSDFLNNVTTFSAVDTTIALGLAFAIGLFILLVYKKTFKGVLYSSSFGVSLLAMTLITTFIIIAVTSNVVLSLGMVGALSIVRFRTAVKEPLDISFLFWSIAAGIVLGAGFLPLAVFGSVFIGLVLVVFVNKKPFDNPYILVVNCESDDAEAKVINVIQKVIKKYVVKSKTVSAQGVEFTIEIRLPSTATEFVNELLAVAGVKSAVLVSYNGDYMA